LRAEISQSRSAPASEVQINFERSRPSSSSFASISS
jgi:hypothetical protein